MAILGFELDEIARLLAMVDSQGLDELIIEEEGRYLRIRGPRRPKPTPVYTTAVSGPPLALPAPPATSMRPAKSGGKPRPEATNSEELKADQIALNSPMVGIFYRSDKPGAAPFIQVGDHVSVGQAIGIIEAMKVFSEVPAEHAGTVTAIPAKDGQLVQAETPLVILRKD